MVAAGMTQRLVRPLSLPGSPSIPVATAFVVLASIGFGLVPFFARSLTEAGMAPPAVALSRYLIPALVFLPFVWRARHLPGPLAWGVAAGVCVGLGWIGYVRALEALPVATVGVLYMTFPVFALVVSWVLFGDRPAARGLASAGLVIVAALLAAGPGLAVPGSAGALAGAVAAPLTFGAAIAILVHRLTPLPPIARLGAFSLGSSLGLLPLAATLPFESVLPGGFDIIALVIGIALVSALIPQLLYSIYAPVVGAARASAAGAIELPTMILVGWVLLSEQPTVLALTGCALIFAAIAIAPAGTSRERPPK